MQTGAVPDSILLSHSCICTPCNIPFDYDRAMTTHMRERLHTRTVVAPLPSTTFPCLKHYPILEWRTNARSLDEYFSAQSHYSLVSPAEILHSASRFHRYRNRHSVLCSPYSNLLSPKKLLALSAAFMPAMLSVPSFQPPPP